MSSIVSGMNAERTNRWLLIGAAVLAVVAGVLIFAALSTFGNDDGETVNVSEGNSQVLVAKRTIAAGTQLDSDDFRVAAFGENDIVAGAIADPDAIVGLTTRVELLEGQQLSQTYIVQGEDNERAKQLAFKFENGMRGVSISVSDEAIVGGHVVPGDHVDVLVSIREKRAFNSDEEFLRVETVLQNVEVLARAETPVEGVVVINDAGEVVEPEEGAIGPDIERRPEEVDASESASTLTIKLSPDDVQRLVVADALGEIVFSLRPFGDEVPTPLTPIVVPVFE